MRFRSLRTRFLIPLAGCSLAVALVIGVVSYRLGDAAAQRELDSRFASLDATLRAARFPLTGQVLQTLATLSAVELATYDADGRRLQSTLEAAPSQLPTGRTPRVAGYQGRVFLRPVVTAGRGGEAHRVLALVPNAQTQRERFAAAALPLITGLSSTVLLSLVAWVLTERIIARIGRLEQTVNRIAEGEFASAPAPPSDDELGRLEGAVRRMGAELKGLWEAVHRQERQRLIHQMAAGLAHQLRNALTGARMAIDLHRQRNPAASGQGLSVALREIQRTEEYVQRILSIAEEGGQEQAPGSVDEALESVRESLAIIARHHRVDLSWELAPGLGTQHVADVSSLRAAVENLVLNALQSGGRRVQVSGNVKPPGQAVFEVRDDGPGPPTSTDGGDSSDLGDLFDPFVTTKPEGLGLGLTLVRRAAENLGGEASWERVDGATVFTFRATLVDPPRNPGDSP